MKPGSGGGNGVAIDELISEASAALYVKDRAGRYLYVNRYCELLTGISSELFLGSTDDDLFPPEAASVFRKDDLRVLEEMSPLRFEEPAVIQGSERVLATVKFPVVADGEAIGVCGLSIDITDELPAEPAAEQSRADAFFGRLLASLTPQEVRVLDLVVTGLSDREIAERLDLSGDTVRHHVSHLLRKLRKRRAQVIIEMLKRG